MKTTIYKRNNSLKLPDGRTIQQALVDNTNLQKMKIVDLELLSKTKKKITEVHNFYFE